ncbi:TPA: hypothetical protein N2X59_000226 [Escherichia coli]|uniref:Uncharacterized protein n=4 Tax=Escherichia coli TaxID=562 RepID=A0A229EYQ1_ECOLX|nr:hypothetical protein [Escherichia coli]ELJ0535085.1 hypothetical protein [Escherichia coli O36]HCA7281568.1 hypothetical protein [Escherichia coli O157:H45]AWR82465.1 hypothetical protein B9T59_16095 [Escherichia coli]AYW28630.1 hypothetical protein CQP61_03505 [Escherichia coli]EEV5545229.1 hypothetical protein [Escherichia coli]
MALLSLSFVRLNFGRMGNRLTEKNNQMISFLSDEFEEFPQGDFLNHLYRFSVDHHHFIVIFSPIDISDAEYHQYRSEEVGFEIPTNCFDVKFDRQENFDSGNFYMPPAATECSRRRRFTDELAEALATIIEKHYIIYHARAYLAIAENDKLKRYYDRILHNAPANVAYRVIKDVGEEERGYAIQTECFRT